MRKALRSSRTRSASTPAVSQRPGDWVSYKRLGVYYYSRGDYAAAAEEFQKVIDLTPDNSITGPFNSWNVGLDIQTGKVVWEYQQTGEAATYSGVLSTAGDLVFFGEDSGAFAALDAATGKPLWHFQANQDWKASPMTYVFDDKQYIAVASGSAIVAFGLPD